VGVSAIFSLHNFMESQQTSQLSIQKLFLIVLLGKNFKPFQNAQKFL
jgi:hypothetical protein